MTRYDDDSQASGRGTYRRSYGAGDTPVVDGPIAKHDRDIYLPRNPAPNDKETAADVTSVSSALSGPTPENAIRVIAADLKRRHPQVDSAKIVNYLLAAYCPLVKEERGLSDQERRERMDKFSAQVYALVQ